MSKLFGNVTQGFPALIGVLWGITIYSPSLHRWWIPALVLVGAFALMHIGRLLIGRNPLIGCLFIEAWGMAAVSIVAFGTMLVLWLTIHASDFIQGTEEEKKAISSALIGAVTAYLAVLWVKDIQVGEGPFWTGTQFREAVQAAFKAPPKAPIVDTREWDAVWEERVRGNGPVGWGLTARWKRSKIIATI
jgi:hypothetical protein